MRVICINGVKKGDPGTVAPACEEDEIYEGEEYTVVRERKVCGEIGYYLAERSPIVSYSSDRFIRIGDVDEVERLAAWKEQHLTQEDRMLKALAEEMPVPDMPVEVFERSWDKIKQRLPL